MTAGERHELDSGARALPGHPLLALDPDLGQLLAPDRRALAERTLRVRITSFPVGEWETDRLAEADPTHIGLLVIEGVLAREVLLGDTVSTELIGPGDIVRPWHVVGPPRLLPVAVRWNALAEVRLGLIDRRVAAMLAAYPEISAVIVDRLSERAERLTITQAICQLNRVDRRLLALFWHLAERWGRVSRDGIAVPLTLSHRLIGELVGARRPTVSTALAGLARTGDLVRRDDGTWLLTGEPPQDEEGAAELVRQRRRLMPEAAEAAATTLPEEVVAETRAERPHDPRLTQLRVSMTAAHEESAAHRRQLEGLVAELRILRDETLARRRERAAHLEELRAAAARRRSG